jgi:hypothetical protein
MNEVNDPKGAAGALKAPLGLIPSIAMEHTSWVHLLGSKKYGPFNWRKTGVCATTYVNAILRHLNAWREGEDNDQESGITHLAHIACCCNILMDAQRCGTLQDDRNRLPEHKPILEGCETPAELGARYARERLAETLAQKAHLMLDDVSYQSFERSSEPPSRTKQMEAEQLAIDVYVSSLEQTEKGMAQKFRERAKERAQKIYLQMAEEKELTSASTHGNVQPSPVTGTTETSTTMKS